ncbi:MAG: dihydrodipicolinate synthase family protein [Runella sp.]
MQNPISSSFNLFAAPFTPFRTDGSVHLDLIPVLVEKLIADGLTGAFVCGTNGEGPSLTIAERMAIAEAFVQAAQKRLKIWVHVGHSSIAEARALMQHAHLIGADAASAVAAFYFKPSSVENLVDCMAQIAEAAPQLPFYYYHIPSVTGIQVDLLRFLKIAQHKIPNLQGIKFTAYTLWEYQACLVEFGSRYEFLYGHDEMLLPALSIGSRGAIGSTYNFAAPQFREVVAAFDEGNLPQAQALMNPLAQIVRVLLQYPLIPSQRSIMRWLGYDLGPCRLPLQNLTAAQEQALSQDLKAVGFDKMLKIRLP